MTCSSAVCRKTLVVLAVLCIAVVADAGWQRIAAFRDVVNCGFFFNEQRGFIGLDYPSGIYRTYDGGQTWLACTVPPSGLNGYGTVNDIYMKDSLNGWAVAEEFGSDGIFGEQLLWRTTDGGVSWQSAPAIVESGTSVYETLGGRVLYSKRYGPPNPGLWVSNDQGNSFNFVAAGSYTDIDFVDDLHGVAAPFNTPTLWTNDGGQTWVPSTYIEESWGVYGEKGTPNFVMAGEQHIGTFSRQTNVVRSTTYGMSWNQVGTIPVRSTGHIAGVGKVIYVQSDNLHSYNFQLTQGMYRTTDGGFSWKWVAGPDHYRDSRFCVVGCLGAIVYAFDGVGGVWKTTDGGDGLISEPPKSPSFYPAFAQMTVDKCSNRRDTFVLSNLSCETVTIESIEFLDSTMEIILSEALKFGNMPLLPAKLDPTDSRLLSVIWDPSKSVSPAPGGTNYIRIRSSAFDGSQTFDTLLVVQARVLGNAPTPLLNSDSIKLQSASICEIREELVTIGNPGCDAMFLTDAAINGTSWEVFDRDGNPVAFPITIPSLDATELMVRFTPPATGDYETLLDMKLEKDGFTVDTTVSISCRVFRSSSIAAVDQLDLGSLAICYQLDTTIYIYSTSDCESLQLDSITLGAGEFTMTHDPLPIALGPKDSFAVHIHYTPKKNFTSSASLNAFFSASGDSLSIATSIFGFGVPGSSGVLFTGEAYDHKFLDKTMCGVGDSIEFSVANPGCDTMTLISAAFISSDPLAITYRANQVLPSIFADANDKVTFTVAAYPALVGDHTAQLTLRYQLSDYSIFDTTFNFSSRVTAGPKLAFVSHSDVDLGTTALCISRDTSIEIMNTGCAPVTVKDILVQGSPQYVFTRKRQTPYVLNRFERDTIVIAYVPNAPGGFDAELLIEFNTDEDSVHLIPFDVVTNDKNYLTMQLVERAQSSFAGDTTLFDVVPNIDWLDPELKDISFDLFYDDDLLTYIPDWPRPQDGAVITQEEVIGSTRRLHVVLEPVQGIELRSNIPIITFAFQTALTDTMTTEVKLASMHLNQDDAYYKNCILATNTRDTTFTLLVRCGEPIVQKFLEGRPIFSISQHRPNPLTEGTGYTLKVPVRLEATASIKANVFDEQGRPILEKYFQALSAGAHTLELNCAGMASGSYEYIMSLEGTESAAPVRAKFMIVK